MISTKIKLIIISISLILITSGTILGIILFQNLTTKSIKFGALSGDLHHLPLFVALDNNFFEEEGVDITNDNIVWFPNGNEVMVAFEAKTLDISYLGLAPAMAHKLTQNAPIKIVSGVNVNGSAIMVKEDSEINTLLDLKDKRIGVPSLFNMQDFVLQIGIEQEGLTIEDVQRIVLSVGNMESALLNDQIDAFVAWEPFSAKALDSGAKYLKKSSEVWPNHPCCVIAASLDFLNDYLELAKKIVQVHKKSLDWMLNPINHESLVNIAKKYTNIDSNTVIETALENIGYVYDFTTYQSEIERFYDDFTSLNPNIPAWEEGQADFFQNFFESSLLNA